MAKQAIIWRHDLQCRLGKKMAQAGHAANADAASLIRANMDSEGNVSFKLTPAQMAWYQSDPVTEKKIVLRVESEEDLMTIYNRAKELGLPVNLITDCGLTEWDAPTRTCVSIGPDEESKIDAVTGDNGPLGRLKTL